ncbi:hypothetical protein ACM25O_13265 [Sulfitobacter pontiacus]
MPGPHYDGPTKPDKGQEGGSCNRELCQDSPALWFNHGSYAWYCGRCRHTIEFDSFNLRDWQQNHQPKCGHPMFETREMMTARRAMDAEPEQAIPFLKPPAVDPDVRALSETLNARLARLVGVPRLVAISTPNPKRGEWVEAILEYRKD